MTKLTDDQLAKRAATKRNNRLRASMPLFSSLLNEGGDMADWLTTPVVQKERIQRQHARFAEIWAGWEESDRLFKVRGDERRAEVAKRVDVETLSELDAHYEKLFAHHDPCYWADYWWGKLVKYAPDIAQAQCPNGRMHSEFSRWHDRCPTCDRPLEPAPATGQMDRLGVRQLMFQEAVIG
jgi:hypothetical protein